jgi:membrane-bound hydrogenase subunit beta
MKEDKIITAEEIVKLFNDKFKTKIKDIQIRNRAAGIKKIETPSIWMKIDKTIFKDLIKYICEIQFPHLAIISGNDLGKTIELIYHLSLNYGNRLKQINLNISVELPKSKPEIETICDWIPGSLITEREKIEMFGIKIIGIPDDRRCFVPEDFPKDVYPWRRDEKGPEKFYKNLHEVKK